MTGRPLPPAPTYCPYCGAASVASASLWDNGADASADLLMGAFSLACGSCPPVGSGRHRAYLNVSVGYFRKAEPNERMQLSDVSRHQNSNAKARSDAAGIAPEVFAAAVAAVEGKQRSAGCVASASEEPRHVTEARLVLRALVEAGAASALLEGVNVVTLIRMSEEMGRSIEPQLTLKQLENVRTLIAALDRMISQFNV